MDEQPKASTPIEAAATETGATRSGFVALIGAPNAGKSTLVNRLVGTKVSIVTHKVQTTRALVRGIALHRRAQIVFVDTPGVFAPRRRLDRAMVKTAWGGARDADIILAIVDAERGLNGDVELILERLKDVSLPVILLLNKVDRIKRDILLGLTQEMTARIAFERVFMISALTGSGCEDLLNYLAEALPEGPWYYPEDQVSDMPMRQLAAEITREKLFLRLHQELPYASTVETELWETRPDGSVRVEQTIYVERPSQKAIVLGRKGETIKAIGQAARKEITEVAECKIHLFLFVKVRENWSDDPERYREMGLDFSAQDTMEWRERAIVLGVRRHGETSVVAELMTRGRGRHLGLVRGGRSRRQQPVLQPGNHVEATWRARLDEHLGTLSVEPLVQRAAHWMDAPMALNAVQLLAAHLRLLAEREAHPRLYDALEWILDRLHDPMQAAGLVLDFERALLEDLGFGLDLQRCALTGETGGLAYVSPRTGRAVTAEAGRPWKDKLLVLPPSFLDGAAPHPFDDLGPGFQLTGHFLARNLWLPRGLDEPGPRRAFILAVIQGGAGG